MSATVPAAVNAYFQCLNREDWDGFVQLWHPEAEVRAVGARPRRGVGDIVSFYKRLFLIWPQHLDTPTRFLRDADAVTVEVHFAGATSGGRRLEFDAVDVIDLADNKIRRLSNWYDIAAVRAFLAESR